MKRVVKPDPTQDLYVVWDNFSSLCSGSGRRDSIEIRAFDESDLAEADRIALTASPDELFQYGVRGFIRRADIPEWLESGDFYGKWTTKCDSLLVPMHSASFGVASDHIYAYSGKGFDRSHIVEVEDFYLEHFASSTVLDRRQDGDEDILGDFSPLIREHLSDTDWLGWASMIFHLDSFWNEYVVVNSDGWSEKNAAVLAEKIPVFASAVAGADWRHVYLLLDAMERGGLSFSMGSTEPISSFLELVRLYGWNTFESFLPAIALGGSSDDVGLMLGAGIDNELAQSVMALR